MNSQSVAAGRSPGLTPHTAPVLAVCTHGRHDTCCAERGRPVAAGLAEAYPEETWEASHIGGDRFAANLLVLPFGLYFGRLDPASARGVARLLAAGDVEADPGRLNEIEERLFKLQRLLRKHGPTTDELIAHRTRLSEELAALDGVDDRIGEDEQKRIALLSRATEQARKLSGA